MLINEHIISFFKICTHTVFVGVIKNYFLENRHILLVTALHFVHIETNLNPL